MPNGLQAAARRSLPLITPADAEKNAAATGSSATDGTTTSGATESPDDGTATTAAQIVSQSLDLDTLLNTGIGKILTLFYKYSIFTEMSFPFTCTVA